MSDKYSKVMLTLLTILNQVKLYHWQTLSHPRHKATDELYGDLSDLIDKFIEVLMGRLIIENKNLKNRILLGNKNKMTLDEYTDNDAYQLINNIKSYFESEELNEILKNNTELANIRDEMLAAVNKVSYLFSLS
jgi:hypothetical protein